MRKCDGVIDEGVRCEGVIGEVVLKKIQSSFVLVKFLQFLET